MANHHNCAQLTSSTTLSLSHCRELMGKTITPFVWCSAFSMCSLGSEHGCRNIHNPTSRCHFKLMTPNLQWSWTPSLFTSHFPASFTLPRFWITNSLLPFVLLLKLQIPSSPYSLSSDDLASYFLFKLLQFLWQNWNNLQRTFPDSQHHNHPPTSITHPCSAFLPHSVKVQSMPLTNPTVLLNMRSHLWWFILCFNLDWPDQALFWMFLWGFLSEINIYIGGCPL